MVGSAQVTSLENIWQMSLECLCLVLVPWEEGYRYGLQMDLCPKRIKKPELG